MSPLVKVGLIVISGLVSMGSYHCVNRVLTIRNRHLTKYNIIQRYR